MSNANIAIISTANTFNVWLTQTNNLANALNGLLNSLLYSDNGNLTLANGQIQLLGGSFGTPLSVTGNVTVTQQLTCASIKDTGDLTVQGNTISFSDADVVVTVANTVNANNLIANTLIIAANANIADVLNVETQLVTPLANLVSLNATAAAIATANVATLNATSAAIATANVDTANTGSLATLSANVADVLNVATQIVTALANVDTLNVTSGAIATANVATLNATTANVATANVGALFATSANVSGTANVITDVVVGRNLFSGNISISFNANVGGTLNASGDLFAGRNVYAGNVNTVNVNATGNVVTTQNLICAGANIKGVLIANNITLDNAGSYSAIQGNLTINDLTVKGNQTVEGTTITSSDTIQLRTAVGSDGDGYFDVYRGTTVAANATIKFNHSANVFQVAANDAQTFETILTTENLVSSFASILGSTDTTDPVSASGANAVYYAALTNATAIVANNGVFVAQRRGINVIQGTNMTITAAANGSNSSLTDITFTGDASPMQIQLNGTNTGVTGNMNVQSTTTVNAAVATNSTQSNISFSANISAVVGPYAAIANTTFGTINAAVIVALDDAEAAYAQANLAYAQANTARGQANTAYDQANLAYAQANTANGVAQTASSTATTALGDAEAAYAEANSAYSLAGTAKTIAEDAYAQANSAYAQANVVYSNTGTVTGTTYDLDCSSSQFFDLTLAGNPTLEFINSVAAGLCTTIQIMLRQSANGSNTVTWANNIGWSDNTTPTLSTTAKTGDVFQFTTFTNGKFWLGAMVMANIGGVGVANTYG